MTNFFENFSKIAICLTFPTHQKKKTLPEWEGLRKPALKENLLQGGEISAFVFSGSVKQIGLHLDGKIAFSEIGLSRKV